MLLQVGDVNALSAVVVAGRYDLDDLVAGELEAWDVCGAASHQVSVEDPQDGLVGDDEEIVLFALELEDNWLEAYG